MTMFFAVLIGVALSFALIFAARHYTGFAAHPGDTYADVEPPLSLPEHLSGRLECQGMIFGPTGRMTSNFRATICTTWDGPNGIMDEEFRYGDGSEQHRQWRLTIGNDGSVRAEADDVPSPGRGTIAGNALRLRYRIRLPASSGGHLLDAVDWMYLQSDGTLLNRSQFRKFGFKVAELFCVMRPEAANNA